MDKYETSYRITAEHPALPGHFPGSPVVPGVVILDHVLQALYGWQHGVLSARVQDAKFVSPLLPDQTLQVELTLKDEQSVSFVCRVADRTTAQGRLKLQRNGA